MARRGREHDFVAQVVCASPRPPPFQRRTPQGSPLLRPDAIAPPQSSRNRPKRRGGDPLSAGSGPSGRGSLLGRDPALGTRGDAAPRAVVLVRSYRPHHRLQRGAAAAARGDRRGGGLQPSPGPQGPRTFEAELLAIAGWGAKSGVRLWLLTQKPSADGLPTALRTGGCTSAPSDRITPTAPLLPALGGGSRRPGGSGVHEDRDPRGGDGGEGWLRKALRPLPPTSLLRSPTAPHALAMFAQRAQLLCVASHL